MVSTNFIFVLIIGVIITISLPATAKDNGYLENSSCKKAQDCYVLRNPNQGLWLACYYDVGKCKCENTISSDYRLQMVGGQCLQSKYGPCGSNGKLSVGCQEGFICLKNQCRDPLNKAEVKVVPYTFPQSKCRDGNCDFSEELKLECSDNRCQCKAEVYADGPSPYFEIKSYDGAKNCSVGKFGPCGNRKGVFIECHGEGISCVGGSCLDAKKPISEAGENCLSKRNCKEGLICSADHVCIQPSSKGLNERCNSEGECKKGLSCQWDGPFHYSFCKPLGSKSSLSEDGED